MIIVVDTNIVYQALKNDNGASFFILKLIRHQKINIAVSLSVFKEYEDVLKRPSSIKDFGLKKTDIVAVLRLIAYMAKPIDPRFLFRPNLIDEDDNKFVELAVASNADFLITSNIKDFKNAQLKFDLNIITPGQFVKNWRKENE